MDEACGFLLYPVAEGVHFGIQVQQFADNGAQRNRDDDHQRIFPLETAADADVEDAQCHALHYKGLKPPAKAVSGHVVGGVLGDGLYGKPNQRACDNGKLSGADSLGYLPADSLREMLHNAPIGFCDACFSGNYPAETTKKTFKGKERGGMNFDKKC